MAWTISECVRTVETGFDGEIIAEYGDIESDAPNPEQKTVVLWTTPAGEPRLRAIEAWDYAQQWADRSGRPVRLRVSGELFNEDSSSTGSWGVKTFQPRVSGGTETGPPLPVKSAFSGLHEVICCASAHNRFGTWYVPYGRGLEKASAMERLSPVPVWVIDYPAPRIPPVIKPATCVGRASATMMNVVLDELDSIELGFHNSRVYFTREEAVNFIDRN